MNQGASAGSVGDAQRQLELANSQLTLYARDLKRIVDTERQKARELAEANARLQVLDRLKSDFLSFISHELRTPLNYMTALSLLDLQGDPAEQAEMLEIVKDGYHRLEGFVTRGLEYFDWLAGQHPPCSEVTDLGAVLRAVVAQMPELRQAGVDFVSESVADACPVRGESRYLAQVLHILLDNALRYSRREKFIRLELTVAQAQAVCRVTDRGQGFPPELAGEIFRPFTALNVNHYPGGSGLNLALANAIITSYDGTLRAESRGLNQGSCFTLVLPLATSS